MGTTKLTRKEILAEDPVHEAIIRLLESFRVKRKLIAIAAVAGILLVGGIYLGYQYLGGKEELAQQELAKGIEYYHGQIDQSALDDPYGKGPIPLFRTSETKYKAALKEFSSVISGYSYSRLAVVARYYLALCQLKLGQDKDAIQNLESVGNNSRNRPIGFLAKRSLANHCLERGDFKGAQGILENLIQDAQCDLPKEDMKADLAHALNAQGKRDEAVKLLKEAKDQAGPGTLTSRLVDELNKIQQGSEPVPQAGQTTNAPH